MKTKQSVENTPGLSEALEERWQLAERRCCEIVDLDRDPPVRYTSIHTSVAMFELKELKEIVIQELANLKAQVRKEIEGLKLDRDIKEHQLLVASKNGYNNCITDCLSIPSLKGEE